MDDIDKAFREFTDGSSQQSSEDLKTHWVTFVAALMMLDSGNYLTKRLMKRVSQRITPTPPSPSQSAGAVDIVRAEDADDLTEIAGKLREASDLFLKTCGELRRT